MDGSAVKAWFFDADNWKKILLPLLIVLAVFITGRFIDIHEHLKALQGWIWTLGPWGPLVFGAIYVAAMLLLLPGTPFTIMAALLFGTLWGFVTMICATTTAALAGFLLARYLMRDRFEKRFQDEEAFQQLTTWVEGNHWLAIPFIRVMPIFPFAINNYALGMTKISFWTYLVASELVFVPMTVVLVFGASALYSAMVKGEISWWLILGSLVTGMLVLALGLAGKKFFNQNN